MSEIKCLENYYELREMFLKGEKGNMDYFIKRIGIQPRTFYRLIKYLEKIDGINIQYNKFSDVYHMK